MIASRQARCLAIFIASKGKEARSIEVDSGMRQINEGVEALDQSEKEVTH